MITKEDFQKSEYPLRLKLMVNGGFGTGKTTLAQSFPKWAYAMIEPGGIAVAKQNQRLLENMVHYEEFVPRIDEDVKDTFMRLSAYCTLCRQEAKEGKIQTFILDNGSHLSQNRWEYVQKYEASLGLNSEHDVQKEYGALSRWMWSFFVKEVISIPAHVVVTFHQMEEEVVVDPIKRQVKKTGRIITDTLGSFRKDAPGLFNASIFLERDKVVASPKYPSGYRFKALCLGAENSGKPAKNNLGLPEVVEDISYEKIMSYLTKKEEK